ncbi:MAG: hypothetical protein LVR00_07480 [Rhabdochlamydiaceae bacterium]
MSGKALAVFITWSFLFSICRLYKARKASAPIAPTTISATIRRDVIWRIGKERKETQR